VLELTEQVAAAHLLACSQALRLRERSKEINKSMLGPGIAALMQHTPLIEEDAPLDKLLTELTGAISRRDWRLDWANDLERAE
jgi:histidine ammonia-lyase